MDAVQGSAAHRAPVVLVIDDEDYVADMLASGLELEGYTVHVAYNGRDGLVQAQNLSLDLIIIDIMMPYLSGPTLIQYLRQQDTTRTVSIILISADARPQQPQPRVLFMPKPFDLDRIMELVKEQTGFVGNAP